MKKSHQQDNEIFDPINFGSERFSGRDFFSKKNNVSNAWICLVGDFLLSTMVNHIKNHHWGISWELFPSILSKSQSESKYLDESVWIAVGILVLWFLGPNTQTKIPTREFSCSNGFVLETQGSATSKLGFLDASCDLHSETHRQLGWFLGFILDLYFFGCLFYGLYHGKSP